MARTYAIIGGTSGIGFDLARQLVARGDRVLIGGRSQGRIDAACARLGDLAAGSVVDSLDRRSLRGFFAKAGPIDGLFTPGSTYVTAPFRGTEQDTAESPFRAKFWGQYWSVFEALGSLNPRASAVLMSGGVSVRPMIGAAAYAACNAAVEGLTRALALELAPIRVNCVSPGMIDSELWRNRPADIRLPAAEKWRSVCTLERAGTVEEAAGAALFLLDNAFMTGSTLYVDGGYTLR